MRKCMKILALAGLFTVLLCGSALAADEYVNGAGFYNVTSGDGLPVTAGAPTGVTLEKVSANVDGKEGFEDFQVNSDRLTVTVTSPTSGKQYLVLLAAGSGNSLPTVDSEIYYIDQVEAGATGVTFNALPKLPVSTGPVKLFVTSDDGSATRSAQLGYAVNGRYEKQPYLLGDADGSGVVDVSDVTAVVSHIVENKLLTGSNLLAANVVKDGDDPNVVDVTDATRIISFVVGNIPEL